MSDELLDDNVELYPAWRQALVLFTQARMDGTFAADTIVPHAWFYEAFGLPVPDERTITAEAFRQVKLRWLGQFKRLQFALLEQHQVDLVSEPGLGYRIVPSREQSKLALEQGISDINKAVQNMVARSTHVNTGALTADERREHANNLVRIAALRNITRQARQLPNLEEG